MRVSIFGLGYVGTVSTACLADTGHHVVGVDVNADKCAAVVEGRAPFVEADLDRLLAEGTRAGRITATTDAAAAVHASEVSVVCVGTPSRNNGSHDYSHLFTVMDQIGRAAAGKATGHVVIVRSTAMPGTVRSCAERLHVHDARIEVAFVPEFLREGSAVRDFVNPPYVIAGSDSTHARAVARELFSVPGAEFHETSVEVAEMMKCVANAFHALKITFANEIGALAKSLGVDGRDVMQLICQDRVLNISTAYLRPGFAYGGSCLPKDVAALTHAGRSNEIDIPLLDALAYSNRSQIERLVSDIVMTRGPVAILGLAFKPGTDDLRESPMVEVAERLIGKGLDVRICDPAVEESTLMGANLSYVEQRLPHLAKLLHGADDVAEGSATIVVAHNTESFRAVVERAPRDARVFDLVGLPSGVTGDRETVGVAWPTPTC